MLTNKQITQLARNQASDRNLWSFGEALRDPALGENALRACCKGHSQWCGVAAQVE